MLTHSLQAGAAQICKMKKDITLTVAIPSYNRLEPLENIIKQCKKQTDQNFTILISNDAPDNKDIERMVKKHQKTTPNLIYHCNETNLGFSGNVYKLYELTMTRYVWFLCDDDTIFPDSVEKIRKSLGTYEPVVAVYNCTWFDAYGVKSNPGITKDTLYNDILELKDYHPLMRTTFLSTLVLEKRTPALEIKKTNYKDNVYVQVTLSLLLLSHRFKFCEIASTILHRNVGYKYGDFFKFYLVDVLKAVHEINHKFDNKKFTAWMIQDLPNALKLYLSQKLGLFRYAQEPSLDTINKISKYYGNYKYFIYSFKYIKLLTPTIFLKIIYFAQLVLIHGYKNAFRIYNQNINRAYTDNRKGGFMNYKYS